MTADKSRTGALTDHLHILSVNEEAMEEAIERFDGSSTGEALKCVLHAQKQLRALLVTSGEQHEAAPAKPFAYYTDWPGRRVYAAEPHGFNEPGLVLDGDSIKDHWHPLVEPSAPLEGTGNGADKRAVFETWAKERFPAKYLSSDANSNMDDYRECAWEGFQRGCTYARAPRTEVAGAVPEGWKLVPEVITQPMMRASGIGSHSWGCALEAAPQPPSADAAAASQPISCKCRRLGDWDGAHHPLCDGAASQPASAAGQDAVSFQSRVQPWMLACFGAEIAADRIERNHRFLEEALELVQAIGCTASEAHQLVDYTFGRPNGEPAQEVGGVMVTLAALCLANDLDMHAAGETELARVWTKVEQIRAKQAAKPKHSPLPEAAPPAQVATRQELTDEEREAIEFAVKWFDQSVLPDTPYAGYCKVLRVLLEGAKHA